MGRRKKVRRDYTTLLTLLQQVVTGSGLSNPSVSLMQQKSNRLTPYGAAFKLFWIAPLIELGVNFANALKDETSRLVAQSQNRYASFAR